ncbi:MAG: F0F1 ATP synthase subunit [Planctomycetes bacterium]|nr:F0F1 ATP synthase subunit [Planctomycetota bacterium]
MPETPDSEQEVVKPRELSEEVGAKEARKIRARRDMDRTIWFGLGMFGLVGWSVAIPTLIGVGLGIWLDLTLPGRFSWTLALLLAGAALGAMNAWYWVSQEQQAMDREREQQQHE